uniref:Cytosolic Fe-S cluster assembly factor NUBP2 homolog n=1 Tax=Lygus hesperus TaxID=30085 RepID=A0A0A9Y463_LYGHE
MEDNSSVKHVILVLSGKGGVGKSTVSTQLALGLREKDYKVGLLDIDLCGPSIPHLLGLEGSAVHRCPEGWVPVYADKEQKLAVMSIGFLLSDRKESVIWRGPKKTSMIKQFLQDVHWQELDYLIIDTPPGTSDEHITVVENLAGICDGAVIVTTPQQVALEDVRKEISFCKRTGVNLLGIVENMSGFVCPNCTECSNIFSTGGGKSLAEVAGIPFLGAIPIDPKVSSARNGSIMGQRSGTAVAEAFTRVLDTLITNVENSEKQS